MTTENPGEKPGEGTPAAPPAAEQPTPASTEPATTPAPAEGGDTPSDDKGGEPMIPKSRFDDALAKERSKRDSEMLELKQEMDAKLQAAANSLSGTNPEGEVRDKDIAELSKKYGVEAGFLQEYADIYAKRAEAKIAETLKPLQSQQANAAYDGEFNKLMDEFPEAASMNSEEKEEFRKLAHEPQYTKTSLTDLWKIKNFDRPQGQRKTVESGRGRGAGFASQDVDISAMSNEEFLAYGEKLAKEG
jgi:hypothetical protein